MDNPSNIYADFRKPFCHAGLESREYGRRDPSRWPRGTLYTQRLALTSPTSGGRSVGIFRSRNQATELQLCYAMRSVDNSEIRESLRTFRVMEKYLKLFLPYIEALTVLHIRSTLLCTIFPSDLPYNPEYCVTSYFFKAKIKIFFPKFIVPYSFEACEPPLWSSG
jgi:hypothetical protein